ARRSVFRRLVDKIHIEALKREFGAFRRVLWHIRKTTLQNIVILPFVGFILRFGSITKSTET
ncbi:MAG TPA: hypothetical protein PK557_07690, partial [Paludibacteraceae bacterium]|nr:hypothetical protein [Paludibacteraceae bacterium]